MIATKEVFGEKAAITVEGDCRSARRVLFVEADTTFGRSAVARSPGFNKPRPDSPATPMHISV
jgi:hypothetical protein